LECCSSQESGGGGGGCGDGGGSGGGGDGLEDSFLLHVLRFATHTCFLCITDALNSQCVNECLTLKSLN